MRWHFDGPYRLGAVQRVLAGLIYSDEGEQLVTRIDEYQDSVRAFMEAGGQPVRNAGDPGIPARDDLLLGNRMLEEEVREMLDAIDAMTDAQKAGDNVAAREALVEYADALGDIVYVAIGRAAQAGIDLQAVLEEISASNMSKIDWVNREPWVVKPDGKIGKDHHYRAPDLWSVMFG